MASLNQELANQEASVMSLSDDMKKQAADFESKMATLAPAGTVSALRIEPGVADELRRMGFERIEQLVAAPRAPLAKRFGLSG